jgi:hypothetical protein
VVGRVETGAVGIGMVGAPVLAVERCSPAD